MTDQKDFSRIRSNILRIGAWSAVGVVLVGMLEIAITFLPGGSAPQVTVLDWLALFQRNPYLGLRNLGLMNIFLNLLAVPFYLAAWTALRGKKSEFTALLAFLLTVLAVSVFLATNRAFAMLALSKEYVAAINPADLLALESAAKSLLAVGESHTPGTFPAFFLAESAGILLSLAMLREDVFPRAAGWTGLIGFSALLLFEILSSFFKVDIYLGMGLAMVGGLSSMAWNLFSAASLRHLARTADR